MQVSLALMAPQTMAPLCPNKRSKLSGTAADVDPAQISLPVNKLHLPDSAAQHIVSDSDEPISDTDTQEAWPAASFRRPKHDSASVPGELNMLHTLPYTQVPRSCALCAYSPPLTCTCPGHNGTARSELDHGSIILDGSRMASCGPTLGPRLICVTYPSTPPSNMLSNTEPFTNTQMRQKKRYSANALSDQAIQPSNIAMSTCQYHSLYPAETACTKTKL